MIFELKHGSLMSACGTSSWAPRTDLVVRLIDEHPNGCMHNLCDGIIRAPYPDLFKDEPWMHAGDVYELKVDLWSMDHVFKSCHSLTYGREQQALNMR